MILPGDSIYINGKGLMYTKPRKGRYYGGKYPKLKNPDPIAEGSKCPGAPTDITVTAEMTAAMLKLKDAAFSISTNTVKIPEMKKQEKAPIFQPE